MTDEHDFYKEYFEKMAKIQEEMENGGPTKYSGAYKSIHAGQALLYDMAASASASAEAANKKAEANQSVLHAAVRNLKILAGAVGIIFLLHLPQILAWLEVNWKVLF